MSERSDPQIIEEFQKPIRFTYNGEERVLHDAVRRLTSSGKTQIAGRQVKKGDQQTDEIRVFREDQVQGEIKEIL